MYEIKKWLTEEQLKPEKNYVCNKSKSFGFIDIVGRKAQVSVKIEFEEDEWD